MRADGAADQFSSIFLVWAGPGFRYHLRKGELFPGLGEMDGAHVPEGACIGDYPDAFPLY